jgi:hypothetical protein
MMIISLLLFNDGSSTPKLPLFKPGFTIGGSIVTMPITDKTIFLDMERKMRRD